MSEGRKQQHTNDCRHGLLVFLVDIDEFLQGLLGGALGAMGKSKVPFQDAMLFRRLPSRKLLWMNTDNGTDTDIDTDTDTDTDKDTDTDTDMETNVQTHRMQHTMTHKDFPLLSG